MKTLYIDTRDNNNIVVRLETEERKFEETSEARKERAQAALPMIERILTKAGIKLSDVDEIKVETGPGSYTGLRVGIAIANALSFGGNIKINGKEPGDIVLPEY